MKQMQLFFLTTIGIHLLFAGCKKEDVVAVVSHGKNRSTLEVDGFEREFYLHVPKKYDGNTPVPVVFMLHGTSGDGERFYDISGWKEVGEEENIITVFPSSDRYCIIDDGVRKMTTKWNSQPAEWNYCPGEVPKNDIKFLNQIIDHLIIKYNINEKKIYLAGFSNGGQMAAQCAIFMSDRLAAIVESAGSFSTDTTYTPLRKLPVTFQLGNKDYGPGVDGPEVPLSQIDAVIQSLRLSKTVNTHTSSFDLNKNYTITGDTAKAMIATFPPNTGGQGIFNFAFIDGLGHVYPNGNNHWMIAARVNWEWFNQFSLP